MKLVDKIFSITGFYQFLHGIGLTVVCFVCLCISGIMFAYFLTSFNFANSLLLYQFIIVIESDFMLQATIHSLMQFPRELPHGFIPDYIKSMIMPCNVDASKSIQVIDINFLKKLATISNEFSSDKVVSR